MKMLMIGGVEGSKGRGENQLRLISGLCQDDKMYWFQMEAGDLIDSEGNFEAHTHSNGTFLLIRCVCFRTYTAPIKTCCHLELVYHFVYTHNTGLVPMSGDPFSSICTWTIIPFSSNMLSH